MKRRVSQLAAFNMVLPVKSHLIVIIPIYGSFWKIMKSHLPTERCQRHTQQGGYQRDTSITPPPVQSNSTRITSLWEVRSIRHSFVSLGVQKPILSAHHGTWQCSAESKGFSVQLTISATFKRMSKLEKREPCWISEWSANSSSMLLPGARLHQPVTITDHLGDYCAGRNFLREWKARLKPDSVSTCALCKIAEHDAESWGCSSFQDLMEKESRINRNKSWQFT
jgi:hypothetical protein